MHCAPCTPAKKTFRVVENRCLQCILGDPEPTISDQHFHVILAVFVFKTREMHDLKILLKSKILWESFWSCAKRLTASASNIVFNFQPISTRCNTERFMVDWNFSLILNCYKGNKKWFQKLLLLNTFYWRLKKNYITFIPSACLAIASITQHTCAFVRPFRVIACCIRMTNTRLEIAFILIWKKCIIFLFSWKYLQAYFHQRGNKKQM